MLVVMRLNLVLKATTRNDFHFHIFGDVYYGSRYPCDAIHDGFEKMDQ